MFGLSGKRKIAVVREQGAITGATKAQAGQITAGALVKQLKRLAERKDIAGIVLRVNSPGVRPRCAFCERTAIFCNYPV